MQRLVRSDGCQPRASRSRPGQTPPLGNADRYEKSWPPKKRDRLDRPGGFLLPSLRGDVGTGVLGVAEEVMTFNFPLTPRFIAGTKAALHSRTVLTVSFG